MRLFYSMDRIDNKGDEKYFLDRIDNKGDEKYFLDRYG